MSAQTIEMPQSFAREPYVDARSAGLFIGASDKHVMLLAREGKIPAHPMGEGTQRRHWRFLLSELDEWMRARNNSSVHSCR